MDARNVADEPFLSLSDKTTNEMCTCLVDLAAWAYLLGSDDAHTCHGAPVAVQLVGRTLEEEAVIRMVEIVDVAIREYVINKGATPA